ncbi:MULTISPECIES: cytochrome b/b6 domain-containing protein [Halomonas]|uniref:cytochrome b/b6 domain-containing protein n=1 Tax=Halomonas TaxID=2745 RepID=UPI00289E29E9|nr:MULTISPECIES: cytochrome b/b6 domain-containing protein [Halomonas]
MQRIRVWDVYVRLFHWALVISVLVSFYTMKTAGEPFLFPAAVHAKAGYVTLGLLTFRWLWGFFGSFFARFTTFLRSPRISLGYAWSLLKRRPKPYAGHNPIGGWMVLVMLLSLTFQGASGLFLSDDIFFEAPLYGALGADISKTLLTLHRYNSTLLLVLIGLHIGAIVFHRLLGERLVGAMFTGNKRLPGPPMDADPSASPLTPRPLWLGLLAIACAAGVSLTWWYW